MPRDRIADFFKERTARQLLLLTIFLGLLIVFRKLALTLVFFVIFERLLFASTSLAQRALKWGKGASFALVAGVTVLLVGLTAGLTAGRAAKLVVETRETLPARMEALRENELFLKLKEHLPDGDQLAERASHYGAELARSAAELGHFVIAFIIGLVLAIVYYFERDGVRALRDSLNPRTAVATQMRWFEHLAEAVSLTAQLQLIVAACNTVFTLPVLLLLGIPHVGGLMLVIFVSGLIPVVGNLIAGTVLSLLAYQAQGLVGVALFVLLTFALHKIESYYLNPRLTARHVKLPGFVLILSLLAFEHLFGVPGLFMSFPFLYVTGKILQEFRGEVPTAAVADDEPKSAA
jgi:predicted PurR-regulated permease PerM